VYPLAATTLWLTATLLFWVQPMFSKQVLPVWGGVPAVWNTCLVFYQATLLLGYLYAHCASTWLRVRAQIVLHTVLVWGAVAVAAARPALLPGPADGPIVWLFGAFLGSIGLPFLVLSATAPLLQSWVGKSGHARAGNPYPLYAISSAGSLLALPSYPVLVEPWLPLSIQQTLWTAGCIAAGVLLTACGGLMWSAAPIGPEPPARPTGPDGGVTTLQRLRWLICAFVPSSMLLAVTQYVTTDIAAVPLFWVVPLSLYLGTFVLVFAECPPIRHHWMLAAQTYLVVPLLLFYLGDVRTAAWIDMPLHLTALFVFAMVCHGELAHGRPAAARLTEFYLWMSLGGCLGGMFTALLAPRIFTTMLEYPLLMLAACALRPRAAAAASRAHARWQLGGLGLALLLLLAGWALPDSALRLRLAMLSLLLLAACGGALWLRALRTPGRAVAGLAALWLVGALLTASTQDVLHRTRNFFGTLRVMDAPTEQLRLFYHGTTLHGAQSTTEARRADPLTYFHREGPVGQLFQALASRPSRAIAVFGLGVGTLAAYARPGDAITFFEIDPDVERIARRADWFRYLADSPGRVAVVLGDARHSLARSPDRTFDLVVQDAFSSDTIPVHLLTREAFQLYREKMTEDGLLVFNITNRHLDLEPVLAELIRHGGMIGRIQRDPEKGRAPFASPSAWIVAAVREEALGALRDDTRWTPLTHRSGTRLWTDDYSNVLSVLR
jgi:spermidine synthase